MKDKKQTIDYPVLRAQLDDYSSTFYGPHSCTGCGTDIVKKAFEQGAQSWESSPFREKGGLFIPHHCTHVYLFKSLTGRVLTVLDAALSTNPVQHKAVIDLVKKEFSSVIAKARELEGDKRAECTGD